MKRTLVLIHCFFLLLCSCSAHSVPAWKTASFNHLEQYKASFLSGKDRPAAFHFQKAIEEIKSSGDLSLLMTAYLTRSALQIAVLEVPDQRDYLATAKAAPADPQKDYYLLLEGKFAQLQRGNLPPAYQDLAAALEKGQEERITEEVSAIDEDLSRLIATGLAVRFQGENEALLTGAVEASSVHGWRKPLLRYLDRLESFYRKNQAPDKAEHIRLKLELLQTEERR